MDDAAHMFTFSGIVTRACSLETMRKLEKRGDVDGRTAPELLSGMVRKWGRQHLIRPLFCCRYYPGAIYKLILVLVELHTQDHSHASRASMNSRNVVGSLTTCLWRLGRRCAVV